VEELHVDPGEPRAAPERAGVDVGERQADLELGAR
jgi:hypothetical protein